MNDPHHIELHGDGSVLPHTLSHGNAGKRAPGHASSHTGSARDRSQSAITENEHLLSGTVSHILELIGEDPTREGLLKTPERVAKALGFFTEGYAMDAKKILSGALFSEKYDEMILVKDIELYSLCEHHMVPFFGKAHVAYIPDGKIVGLSKIPRIVDVFARRLQVQERMTIQIRDAIEDVLKPRGVAVIIEAKHMCMVMRGVQKQHSSTTTSAVSGAFRDQETRAELLRLI